MSRKMQQPIKQPTQVVHIKAGNLRLSMENKIGVIKESNGVKQQSSRPIQILEETLKDDQSKLSRFLLRWKEITSDPMILEAITEYKLSTINQHLRP